MSEHAGSRPGASWWVPDALDRGRLRDGIGECKGCELFRDATHGVPGDGPLPTRLVLVGEQPGDQEDRAGEPFVGPAGRLLDQALEAAGIDRSEVYLTNAVKHFRWRGERNGKRLHRSPDRVHVEACLPWLVAELELARPEGVVLLGATAASAVLGRDARVGQLRGRRLPWPERVGTLLARRSPQWVVVTAHPSSVLRSRRREEDLAAVVADLRVAAEDGA